jgi:hypothetical protein
VIANLGWRILYFTHDDIVNQPERTISVMKRALFEAGRAETA